MSTGEAVAISRGFADTALQSQSVFRALLTAMSEPGRVLPCPAVIQGAPLPPVLAAVALTLLDYETPVFLSGALASEEARAFLSFHTGAPLSAKPEGASFVLALSGNELPPIPRLNAGTPDYPDRSATVIVN
ncbi:MAG: phosphonate C-P lyase system protein PhnH, partial [Rhodomicrobium sp.]|nr:phosphonate C-P lyase system protein PhnH [Rhodomicrobium sp.]